MDLQEDDYDSEADSDYDPTKDIEALNDEEDENEQEKGLVRISTKRKFEVESMFETMQAEEEESLRKKMSLSFNSVLQSLNPTTTITSSNAPTDQSGNQPTSNANKKDQKSKKRQEHKKRALLSTLGCIFGSATANSLLKQTNPGILHASSHAQTSLPSPDLPPDINSMVKRCVQQVARRQVVVETRKFAGSDVTVTKSMMIVGSSKSQFDESGAGGSGKGSGRGNPPIPPPIPPSIDQVLAEITGPKAISTVTKSSLDWDTFKEVERLDDDLAAAGKDGYLHRQEFLVRVDHRQFEKEKEERARKGGK